MKKFTGVRGFLGMGACLLLYFTASFMYQGYLEHKNLVLWATLVQAERAHMQKQCQIVDGERICAWPTIQFDNSPIRTSKVRSNRPPTPKTTTTTLPNSSEETEG